MNWRALPYDYKLLKGDPMLILSLSAPFIFWALMQYLFPWLEIQFQELWNIDITPWYRPVGTFFMMLIPMMFGMVYGFILLDERDGGIITAISVTPTGKSGYLELRLGLPLIFSLLFVILFQVLLQLTNPLGILQITLISALIATQALLLLLFLGAFAHNKVMGMAISKGFGIILLGPVLDYILPAPYNWIGACSPLFWAGRAFLAEHSGPFWLYFGIATLFHGLLLWILFRKFLSRSD
jgi:fluoroquinolone transport system permease protein